jgi:hypothetical protein
MPTGTLNQIKEAFPSVKHQRSFIQMTKGLHVIPWRGPSRGPSTKEQTFHATRWFQRERKNKNLGVVRIFSSSYIGRLKTYYLSVVWLGEPSWVRPLRGYILVKKINVQFWSKGPWFSLRTPSKKTLGLLPWYPSIFASSSKATKDTSNIYFKII